jgi:hypothetical protein
MRALVLAAVTVVAPVLIACGDGGAGAPSTTPATAVPAIAVSPDELDAMRLTLDDVGSFWKAGEPINDADIADSVQVPCNPSLDPAVVQRLRAKTGVQLEPVDGSYLHVMEFLAAGEPTQLAADVRVLFDAWQSCPTTSTLPDGSSYRDLGPVALPELGDQRLARQVKGAETPTADVVWFVRSAMVRVGGVLVEVSLTEVVPTDASPTISDVEFARLVTTAVARVRPA